MPRRARNEQDLKRNLSEPLRKAVDYVVQKIWNENRQQINDIVYNAYAPENYERSGEFRSTAWETTVVNKSAGGGGKIEGSFFYAPNYMSVVSPYDSWDGMGHHSDVHGSDTRAGLADIIYQGLAGPAYGDGPWRNKRDAFTALVKVIGKAKMKQWFSEGMSLAGLEYVSHRTGIGMEII